ncbi:diguanylate cyclase domain-containing protein [Sphingoaurantiacus capsulatus]|uniref:diguanylate cyclase n=1 Tax=Sphingoaurantiacus capsulatus TaxID=1771310 RepID=A0ABV7XAM3_9SPHN
MTAAFALGGRWCIRATFALLLALVASAPARADSGGLVEAPCFTVSDRDAPAAGPCTLNPTSYQQRWLWTSVAPLDGREWRVTVRQSRFDALVVRFHYADGAIDRQSVVTGDFGDRWRIGGKIAFDPPLRHAAITRVEIGFKGLASHNLVRARLIPNAVADRAASFATLATGAALALLGFAAAYNLGVGLGSRKRAALWHSAWAACVFGWGLLWTQTALLIAPGLAGSPSVEVSIFLATCAIACAGQFFVTSTERAMVPPLLDRLLSAFCGLVGVAGALAAVGPRELMWMAEQSISLAVPAAALTLLIAVIVAIRRGSRMARDFGLSWAIPIAAVLWTHISDIGLTADDDSGQLLVLSLCALQTVGLSLIVSHRLASVRRERREAREREAELRTLADTDPLTGLLNRRGFVAGVEAALAAGRPVGLILMDLDYFKSINDRFGHDAGDRALSAVAGAFETHSREATIGRLGGEEFGIAVTGVPLPALGRLAERLRRAIASIDLPEGPGLITASFGVAMGPSSFEPLYRDADRALYRAKAQGRDRVAIADNAEAAAALTA